MRHPLVTATLATTMHRMSGGRFALGLGRGEAVVGHDGPAGSHPYLSQDPAFREDIPIMLVAMGERTLEFAGRVADGVVLHTFFTDRTLARAVSSIRRGAVAAGHDPASVRVWSVLATVGDHLDEEARLRKLVGRLATYLQGYGDLLVRVNEWDPADLVRFRADDLVDGYPGAFDALATPDELRHLAGLLPEHWLEAAATGSPERCARRVLAQFDAGADSVVLHGATPRRPGPDHRRLPGGATRRPVRGPAP
ncbi:hypothetical protein GCM10023088_15520 [Actinomadura verrucosospora]|uniref:LLM class flavin-dependent oxidoreductase n=1 Tax=Actinomadura verrucosospora TaxID=46165 RepID=UPI0031EDBCB4